MPDNTIKPRNKVKIKITKEITTAFIGKINEEKVVSSKTYKYTFSKDYKSKTDKEKKALAKIIFTSETKSKKLNKTDKHTTKKKITSVLTKDLYKKGDTIQIPLIKRKVSFTKLDEAELYDEVYVIVQSKGLESGETIVELRQGDKEELELEGVGIYVQHNNSNVKEIKEKIGNFSKDESIENKDDFKDWSIAKIKLAPKNETKLKLYRKFLKDATDKKANLYLLVKANVSGESFTNTFYNEVHGKIANRWYDGDADGVEWFGLKKKTPVIVIDPGHGYTKGSAGSSVRLYNHKIKGKDGKPEKDKKGNLIIKKSVKLDDLPQYVIDDVETWITGIKKGAYSNKYTERALTYDVAHAIYDELIKKGILKEKLHIFRKDLNDRNENNGKTLNERIKYANKINADYYISIHADGDDVKISTSGAHTIYASINHTKLSKKLASDILKYYSVIPILTESPKKDIRNLAVFKPYHKTKRVTLIEMGYVTNPKEAKKLFSNSKKIGKEIARGLDEHINNEYK